MVLLSALDSPLSTLTAAQPQIPAFGPWMSSLRLARGFAFGSLRSFPMPPDFQFEVSARLLTVTVTGVLLADDVVRFVNAHYPQFRGPQILWDFRAANVSRLAPEKYAAMAIAVRENTPIGIERKTAYVVANDAAQLSMWKYLSEAVRLHVPVEYKAFRSLEAARHWLEGR